MQARYSVPFALAYRAAITSLWPNPIWNFHLIQPRTTMWSSQSHLPSWMALLAWLQWFPLPWLSTYLTGYSCLGSSSQHRMLISPKAQVLASFSILIILGQGLGAPWYLISSLLLTLTLWSLAHSLLWTSSLSYPTIYAAVPCDNLRGAPNMYKTESWSPTHSYCWTRNPQPALLNTRTPIWMSYHLHVTIHFRRSH